MKPLTARRTLSEFAILIAAAFLVAACKQQSANAALGDSALLTHDADSLTGDRTVVASSTADYKLDDNRYRQWTIAQEKLDALGPIDAPVTLTSLNPSAADIDRTVAFLESRPDTRNALAAAGLSARDYVLTTLALAQARGASLASADSETDNERFVSQHRTEVDQVVSRSKFRVVDYDGKGKHKGGDGKGHGHGKGKGHKHGKH